MKEPRPRIIGHEPERHVVAGATHVHDVPADGVAVVIFRAPRHADYVEVVLQTTVQQNANSGIDEARTPCKWNGCFNESASRTLL